VPPAAGIQQRGQQGWHFLSAHTRGDWRAPCPGRHAIDRAIAPSFQPARPPPLTEVARSDVPCGYAIRQRYYLGGPICAAVCPGDALAALSRDGLLIGRSSVRETTKRLVSGLLSLDGPGWEIRCNGSITISKNSLYLRLQQDSNLRTRLRRPWPASPPHPL